MGFSQRNQKRDQFLSSWGGGLGSKRSIPWLDGSANTIYHRGQNFKALFSMLLLLMLELSAWLMICLEPDHVLDWNLPQWKFHQGGLLSWKKCHGKTGGRYNCAHICEQKWWIGRKWSLVQQPIALLCLYGWKSVGKGFFWLIRMATKRRTLGHNPLILIWYALNHSGGFPAVKLHQSDVASGSYVSVLSSD